MGLRADWRLGETCLGLTAIWLRACRRKQAGQRRTAADSSKSLLLARPLPRDLDIEAILTQKEAVRQLEPMRRWSFKQDGENPGLSIWIRAGETHRMIRGPWLCGEGFVLGRLLKKSTKHSQSCRGDEHLTNGAAEASSSFAGVRVCACRQASSSSSPEDLAEFMTQLLQLDRPGLPGTVCPSLPACVTVRAFLAPSGYLPMPAGQVPSRWKRWARLLATWVLAVSGTIGPQARTPFARCTPGLSGNVASDLQSLFRARQAI